MLAEDLADDLKPLAPLDVLAEDLAGDLKPLAPLDVRAEDLADDLVNICSSRRVRLGRRTIEMVLLSTCRGAQGQAILVPPCA